MTNPPKLSQETLELLVVAIIKLRDEQGRALQINPRDVLQPWVIEQFPTGIASGCAGSLG